MAVWRIDSGPDVSSCSSRMETSYSLLLLLESGLVCCLDKRMLSRVMCRDAKRGWTWIW